jgi:flagellar hook assembly protein FlgD
VGLGGWKGQYDQVVYFDDFKIYGPLGPTNVINQKRSVSLDITSHPNPFKLSTTFEFSLTNTSKSKIEIFDNNGRLISNIVISNPLIGQNKFEWNGTDNSGVPLDNGIYYYRLVNGNSSTSRKIVLLK